MKNLFFVFTLLSSTIMISSTSYAEWIKVVQVQGNPFYVDFDKIKN